MAHMVMVNRAGRPEHTTEAEPLIVETRGDLVVLALDDGERLELDRSELLAALAEPHAEAA